VHGEKRREAVAGERVAVNLGGIEVSDLSRGDSLSASGSIDVTRRFDAAIDVLSSSKPLRHGARVRFHQGTSEILGRISVAGPIPSDTSSEPANGPAAPRAASPLSEIPAGRSAYARVRLEAPAVLTRGDRFIIRSYSPAFTIGGGVILDPQAPRGAVRSETGLRRFEALRGSSGEPTLGAITLIREQREAGLERRGLVSRFGLSVVQAEDVVRQLSAKGDVVAIEDVLVAREVLEQLGRSLGEALRQHHSDHPLADGLPREEARERLFRRAAAGVFEHVLATLVADGRIVSRERLALSGHQIVLSQDEAATLETVERLFRTARLAPPDLAAAVSEAHLRLDVADRMAKLLVRQSRLVRLDGILFHVEVLDELKGDVRAMKAAGVERIDVGTFKDRYGLSRKYAIPLLEYLDRERMTRRAGASRVIL
jgi:selenocysteine-specific elongation factor